VRQCDGTCGNDVCTETYCGDGIAQLPNTSKTGGPDNDGYEQCDGTIYCSNQCTCDSAHKSCSGLCVPPEQICPCPSNQKMCNGNCIPTDQTCTPPDCQNGYKKCDGVCVPDNQICPCPSNQKMCNGNCIPTDQTCTPPDCQNGYKKCDDVCVPDNQICPCPSNQKMCNGNCIPTDQTCTPPDCQNGYKKCDGVCIPENESCHPSPPLNVCGDGIKGQFETCDLGYSNNDGIKTLAISDGKYFAYSLYSDKVTSPNLFVCDQCSLKAITCQTNPLTSSCQLNLPACSYQDVSLSLMKGEVPVIFWDINFENVNYLLT